MKNLLSTVSMKTRIKAIGSVVLGLGLASALPAEEAKPPPEELVPPSSVTARVFALGDSDVKSGGASYATSQAAVELSLCHWELALSRQYFSWKNAAEFVEDTGGDDPWEYFNQVRIGFAHPFIHSERWSSEWFAGGVMGFEEEVSESFAGYVGGYATYRIHPRLLLMGGFFYSQHQEISTDFDFVPILGVVWNPEATHGFSFRLGLPETRATWHFNERTRLVLDLKTLEGGVTRLADNSPVREGGYVELVSASLVLRLETRIGEDWALSAGIGHSIHREMKLYDADGGNRRTLDVERAPGVELSLTRTF